MTTLELDLAPVPSRAPTVAGWPLSGLFIAFMIFDGSIKLGPIAAVQETMTGMGWTAPDGLWQALGVLALALTALYAWRPTSVLGAVLLTGYLGGAIVTQLRGGMPIGSHVLFGVYLGALMWVGLWLREPAVRAVLPLRRR